MSTCPTCNLTVTPEVYDLAKFEYGRVARIPAGNRSDWEHMFLQALSVLIKEYETERKPPLQAVPDLAPGRRSRVRRPARQGQP